MRVCAAVLLALSLVVPFGAQADTSKELQNQRGHVSYQRGSANARGVAQNATVVLSDRDTAITGNASLAAVTLPDSSRVLMGSDTRVQLAFFNQAQIASAKFIVYQGKTRFRVEHPAGARANYTFTTPTASIAVRGTEGDIGVDGKNLVVNVYGLSDPKLPVVVTFSDGRKVILNAGQQLLAQWINGRIQTTVGALTSQALAQFSELGAPLSNWTAAVANLPVVGGLVNNVPGAGSLIGGLFNRRPGNSNASPGPSPSPCVTATPGPSNGVMGFLRRAANANTPAPCVSPTPSPTP
jgi:hypothetical protein